MAVVFKAIKPSRFDDKKFRQDMRHAAEAEGRKILKDYQAIVRTWEHKPEFKVSTSVAAQTGGVLLEVWTDSKTEEGQIFKFVDEGTKPHEIWPKRQGGVLAFASAFTPKTRPRTLSSGAGKRGPVDTFRPYVQHPGTEAREYTETIEQKWQKPFAKDMQDAMNKAARESPHHIK